MNGYVKTEDEIKKRTRGLFLFISNAILYKMLSRLHDQEKCDAALEKINDFLSEYNSHENKYLLDSHEIDLFEKINQAANIQSHIDDSTINQAVWKMEELGAYLWLFNSIQMPGYDTQFSSDIFSALPSIENASLIDYKLARNELEKALLYIWRYHLEGSNALRELTIDLSVVIRKRLDEIKKEGFEVNIKDNDLVIFNKPFNQILSTQKETMCLICERRIAALEWTLESLY